MPPQDAHGPIRIKFRRPRLYPKQLAAIFDPKRIVAIEASTKSGKTSGSIAWLCEQAFAGPPHGNYWWVAPINGQSDIAFRRMQRALPRGSFVANLTLKTITLVGGQVIWFKSAEKPDSLYGEDVHAAVIDEASRCKEEAWIALRTTLTATRGPVRVIGNVKGRRNWFYRMARRGEAGDPDIGFHRMDAYDAVAAGVLDAAEIEAAKREIPEAAFRELYLAQASDDEGNPFGLAAIRKCVAPLSTDAPCWYGWDLAKSEDWTVGVAYDRQHRVCRLDRWQRVPWDETIERIKSLTGSTPALVDATGVGDPIVERLQREGGPNFQGFVFTPRSKQQLMENLAATIQSAGATFPEGPLTVELEQFEYAYTRSGVKYSAPEGFHDDCVMALALCDLHAARAPAPVQWTADMVAQIRRGRR